MVESQARIKPVVKVKILVIEDNEDDYDLLERRLKKTDHCLSLKRIETRHEFSRELEENKWDLIISDNDLPNFSAREALALLRDIDHITPFIILSGNIGEEAAVEAMRAGANDYILKGNSSRLIPAINRELQELRKKVELGKIEKELSKTERNYKLLAENVQDLVCVHDQSGEYLWVSPSSERMLGYTPSEFKKISFFHGLHSDDEPTVRENLKSLRSSSIQHRTGRFIYRKQRKDGVYIYLETITNGIYDKNELVKIVSTSRDITEQVQAYQLHEENEARQAGILESLSEGIILLDDKGNIITNNSSADKILDIKDASSISDLLNDQDKVTDKSGEPLLPEKLPYIQTLDSGIAKYNQIIGLRRNGDDYWLSMNTVPYYLSGAKKGIVVSFSNVTQEIENQEQINRFAQELVALIENANAPIFGIDWEGRITEWNHFTEKITGFTKDEVLGTLLIERFILNSHKVLVKDLFKKVLRGKNAINYELPILTKHGQVVTILFNGTTRKDYAGKIIGMIGVGQDITELIEYRGKLELKVEERTQELMQALRKEKELVALKSKFVSMASHEFRTPLSTIQFASDFVRKYYRKAEHEKLEAKFDKINQQVKHMTYLLDDVLVIGKSQAGVIKLNPALINLKRFCKEIFEEIENGSANSHEIERKIVSDSETIFVDEKLLRNILVNLLTNAIKFSPETDRVKVNVSCIQNQLEINVRDWGNGIDEADKDKLFEAFHRGSNVGTIQGTGLGLSIVKKAVEMQEGAIEVESELGKGSTFKVSIPVKYEEDTGN
ncbi:MAG: PAS domain S-box protein [Bacteroidota bacterium]